MCIRHNWEFQDSRLRVRYILVTGEVHQDSRVEGLWCCLEYVISNHLNAAMMLCRLLLLKVPMILKTLCSHWVCVGCRATIGIHICASEFSTRKQAQRQWISGSRSGVQGLLSGTV